MRLVLAAATSVVVLLVSMLQIRSGVGRCDAAAAAAAAAASHTPHKIKTETDTTIN